MENHLLHKPITPAPGRLILLQLNELEFTKRLENILEVAFSDAEMDVTHI